VTELIKAHMAAVLRKFAGFLTIRKRREANASTITKMDSEARPGEDQMTCKYLDAKAITLTV
jgi:hypothetical protein